MSYLEIMQLKESIERELVELNLVLQKLSQEMTEITRLSDPNGRFGMAVAKAEKSFLPLFAALNITAENSTEQEEVPKRN